jgi:hypothetical protein
MASLTRVRLRIRAGAWAGQLASGLAELTGWDFRIFHKLIVTRQPYKYDPGLQNSEGERKQ